MSIEAANIDADVINIAADAVTTARVIDITADALTTGNALYIDDDSSNTGTRNTVEIVQNNVAATGATALKIQSDSNGGVAALSIDRNAAGTAAVDAVTGIAIDLDQTGEITSATGVVVGVDTNIETNVAGDGTLNSYGHRIVMTGDTDGTHTNTGLSINLGQADTNTHIELLSSADTGDKCTIATTTHGATTITTIDDDSHAADLTLTVDGDTIIQAEGTTVARAVGTAAGSTTNVTKAFSALRPYIVMTADTQLYAGDSGAIIVFNDADGAVATLPDAGTAANVGCTFTFLVKVSATSNSHKIVCADTSNEVIFGQIHSWKVAAGMGSTVTATPFNSGGSTSAIIFNGTTTGGIYSEVTVTAVAADTWVVTNGKAVYVSGTQGTPFADS